MTDRPSLMTIFLGEYTVVERADSLGSIAIHLGNNVYINMHIVGLPMTVKPGEKLPLFTQIPYNPRPIEDVLTGKPPID